MVSLNALNALKKPKTRKGRETFARIVAAGEKQFHLQTYPVASITDIAKEAGVGTGTFYLYFDSKQSLFRYLVLSYHHEIRKEIAEATKNVKNRRDIERIGFKTYFKYIFKNPYAYTIIWQSLVVDKDLFTYYYTSFADKYRIGLEDAIKKGEIREDISAIDIAYALIGITNFVGLKLSIFDGPKTTIKDIDAAVDEAMKLLEHGIFTK